MVENMQQLPRHAVGVVPYLLGVFFLPSDVSFSLVNFVDKAVRLAFAVYYVPYLLVISCVVIQATVSAFFAAVLPLVQQQPAVTSMEEAHAWWSAAWRTTQLVMMLIPYAVVLLGIVSGGHKLATCIGEAMVDAYTSTQEGCDYALTLNMVEFALLTSVRAWTLFVVSVAVVSVFTVVFGTNVYKSWYAQRDASVTVVVSLIAGSLFIYCIVSILGFMRQRRRARESESRSRINRMIESPKKRRGGDRNNENVPGSTPPSRCPQEEELEHTPPLKACLTLRVSPSASTSLLDDFRMSTTHWWSAHMFQIRHLSIQMLFVAFAYWTVTRGPIDALAFSVEALMYLNLPNMVGFTVLSITASFVKKAVSFAWLRRHSGYKRTVACVVAPHFILCLLSILRFRFAPRACVVCGALAVGIVARAIDVCRWRIFSTRPVEHAQEQRVVWRYVDGDRASIDPVLSSHVDDAWEREDVDVAAVMLETKVRLRRLDQGEGPVTVVDVQVVTPSSPVTPVGNKRSAPGTGGGTRAGWRQLERICYPTMSCGQTYTAPARSFRGLLQLWLPLFLMQSAPTVSGRRFNLIRMVLRCLHGTMFVVIGSLVVGVLIQETVPPLQPLPTRLSFETERRCSRDVVGITRMTLDHLVVQLSLTKLGSRPNSARREAVTQEDLDAFELELDDDHLGSLCRFKAPGSGIAVFELALLSVGTYVASPSDFHKFVEFVNDALGVDWQPLFPSLQDSGVPSRSAGMPWRSFVHLRHNRSIPLHSDERNESSRQTAALDIIAVRGTDLTSMYDMLEDVAIYTESLLFQLLPTVVPGAGLLPSGFVAELIDFIGLLGETSVDATEYSVAATHRRPKKLRYYHTVNEFLHGHVVADAARRREASAHPGGAQPWPVVTLTGHSLGGAIGHMVASGLNGHPAFEPSWPRRDSTAWQTAPLRATSVAFHSPGIMLPRRRLNLTSDQIHRTCHTIVSSHDMVPAIGGQSGGVVHHLRCKDAVRERCHAMETVIENLWRSCGSIRRAYPSLLDVTVK